MAKLAEINISPLRIAFDHWEQKDIYEKAVRTAVAHGITNLSNYMLYNFRDKPEHITSPTAETLEIADLGFTALADKIHDRVALSGVGRLAADLFYSTHAASPPMNGIAPYRPCR